MTSISASLDDLQQLEPADAGQPNVHQHEIHGMLFE